MFKEKITEVSNATQAGSVLSFLNEILDALQETEVFQENEELMHEIGEAMGSLDNCITILEYDESSGENFMQMVSYLLQQAVESQKKEEREKKFLDVLHNAEEINGCPLTSSIEEAAIKKLPFLSKLYEETVETMFTGEQENTALERTLIKGKIASWYRITSNAGTKYRITQNVFASTEEMSRIMNSDKKPELGKVLYRDDIGDSMDMHFADIIEEKNVLSR